MNFGSRLRRSQPQAPGTIWKYIAGGGTVIGYQAFYDRLKNRNSQNEVNEKIDRIIENINELKDIIKNGKATEKDIQSLADYKNLYRHFKKMADACEKYTLPKGKSFAEVENDVDFTTYSRQFDEAFIKAKNVGENIQKGEVALMVMIPLII